jgi:hypothetical protein
MLYTIILALAAAVTPAALPATGASVPSAATPGAATPATTTTSATPSATAAASATTTAPAPVVRRFAAPEARQAVAVDDTFFYAINNATIGKYDKATGRKVSEWTDAPGGHIKHLNSGVVLDAELYCAHSNYPQTPMISSIEVFDTKTMKHLRTQALPEGLGSATWIDTRDDAWWVTFAQYAGKGGEAGKGPEQTQLVRFDRGWRKQAAWTFPAEVIARWQSMSSSGGAWGTDGLLYTTGHDARELYVLRLPASGPRLDLVAIVPMESEGQGIALDRKSAGVLYSIQRKTLEVLVSTLPALPAPPAIAPR